MRWSQQASLGECSQCRREATCHHVATWLQVRAAKDRLAMMREKDADDVHVPQPRDSVMDFLNGKPHKHNFRPEVDLAKQAAIAGRAPYRTGVLAPSHLILSLYATKLKTPHPGGVHFSTYT